MKRSNDRILTTHVGSLIRPPELLEFLNARRRGETVDDCAHQATLRRTVAEVVARQVEAGIDVVSDGEFGKGHSWSQYVLDRLSGFTRRPVPRTEDPFARGADRDRFPEFYAELDARDRIGGPTAFDVVCTGPVTYTGRDALNHDIANLKAALAASQAVEGFLPVAAPSSVIPDRKNEHYRSAEELQEAIAVAMRTEYKIIADSGIVVQLDDARAAVTYDRMVPPGSFADYRKWLEQQVELINFSLEGIPEELVRYHVCWGSWPGPHTTDVPFAEIADLVLKVKAGAYVIEGANPRHEHEWKVWKQAKLPAGRVVIPGVISHATNVVEHPELVAERIGLYASVVGRENVIAGTDCGFAQAPFLRRVHPSIQWAKLEALAKGARIASKQLWGKAAA